VGERERKPQERRKQRRQEDGSSSFDSNPCPRALDLTVISSFSEHQRKPRCRARGVLTHDCCSLPAAADLRIRVIGVADSHSSSHSSTPHHNNVFSPSPSPIRGSVVTLSLNDLIESDYTDEYDRADQPLWIQVENANPKEIARIGEHFGLHPLTIEGIQTRHTREKLEIFQNYLFLVFHSLHGGSNGGGGGFHEYRDRQFNKPQTQQLALPGTFAATNTVDPYDMTRAQAAEMAGRSTVDADESHYRHSAHTTPSHNNSSQHSHNNSFSPPPLVHEGSRLISGQDKTTARYYGGVSFQGMEMEQTNAMPAPSPLPPRRHKPSMSISRSSSNLSVPGNPNQAAAGVAKTPPPQPSPHRTQSNAAPGSSASNQLVVPAPLITTHVDRFQLPFPMGMGPDVSSPHLSSESGSSAASDTSQSSEEDEPSQSTAGSPQVQKPGAASPQSPLLTTGSPRSPSKPAPMVSTVASAQAVAALARESEPLRTSPIKLVVFPNLVLSFHSSNLDTVNAVRFRLQRVYSDAVESTAWIIHALLDSITDSLLPVVNATAVEVDALEELIYVLSGSEHRDLLKRMGMTRRRLSFLRQRLWSKRDILMSLIGKVSLAFLSVARISHVLLLSLRCSLRRVLFDFVLSSVGLATLPRRRADSLPARRVRPRRDDVAQGRSRV
jgi:Mg2+ and Co2+ transporter CorA